MSDDVVIVSAARTPVGSFNGEIDEVALWKTNLTFSQVTNLVNAISNHVSYPFPGIP